MLGVPWLHSSKTTYQLAVLWLYSNLHPKHRLRHPNVLGLRRGQSQDHWNSSKFTPWPLRHGAAEQCCFKCSRVPVPSQKVHLHFLTNGVTVEWKIWRFDFCKCWQCNHGCCQFGISKEVLKRSIEVSWCVLLHPGARSHCRFTVVFIHLEEYQEAAWSACDFIGIVNKKRWGTKT